MGILKDGVPAEWVYAMNGDVKTSKEKHTIGKYGKVLDLYLLKQALAGSGVCIASFPCYNGGVMFWVGSSTAPDGHCVSIVGYDDDKKHLIIRNSWGSDWGENGYCYMPYDQYHPWEAYSSMDGDGQLNPDLPVAAKTDSSCCMLM
jgi:C1A family cysteine protease